MMMPRPANDNDTWVPLWVCLRMAQDKIARGQSLERANV